MLRHRTLCSLSTERLCPWTETDAMIETVAVVELNLEPLSAFQQIQCQTADQRCTL